MAAPGDLEIAFDERMRQIYEQAATECDYKATRFLQELLSNLVYANMIRQHSFESKLSFHLCHQ